MYRLLIPLTLSVVLCGLAAATSSADALQKPNITLQLRREVTDAAKPYHVIGMWDEHGNQFFVFGPDSPRPDYEFGKDIVAVKGSDGSFTLTGYVVYWPLQRKWFIEPFVGGSLKLPAKTTLSGVLGLYVPANGGPWIIYTNTISLKKQMGEVKMGPGLTFWNETHTTCKLRPGVVVEWREWQVRWLAEHSGSPEKLRLQWTGRVF